MTDISQVKSIVLEKQEIILHKINGLVYEELIQLLASLSSLLAHLDQLHAQSESLCCKTVIENMNTDPKSTISKAETAMKSTDLYLSYKEISALRQVSLRSLGIVRLQLNFLFKKEFYSPSEEETI